MKIFNRNIIYVILPAIIVGLFTLIPMFWNTLTTPKAELIYSLTSGPVLETQTNYRTIVSVKVSNSGKKSLSKVVANMLLEDGEIEAYYVQGAGGLKPIIIAEDQNISVEIPKFHPNEDFSVSLMLILPNAQSTPIFSLRSDEIVGEPASQIPRDANGLNTLGAILAGSATLIIMIIMSIKLGGFPPFQSDDGKSDILLYIPMLLQLPEITNRQCLIQGGLTYLNTADIMLSQGLLSSGKDRENIVKALKCLLLIKPIAATSLKIIENNIRILEGDNYSGKEITELKEHSIRVYDQLKLRNRINEYLENKIVLPQNTKN